MQSANQFAMNTATGCGLRRHPPTLEQPPEQDPQGDAGIQDNEIRGRRCHEQKDGGGEDVAQGCAGAAGACEADVRAP